MSRHFNKLTAGQDEALALLAEEAAEVIHAVTKIQRHGFAGSDPDSGVSNVASLERELGQLAAATAVVKLNTTIGQLGIDTAYNEKLGTISKFLHHAKVPKP